MNKMSSKDDFYLCFNKLTAEKKQNSIYLSQKKYSEIILEIKNAKSNKKKTSTDYRRLKRYDVITIDGEDKLIYPIDGGDSTIYYYVQNESMYDILHEIHYNIGHGGKHRMIAETKKKYKNITQEIILMYLKYCEPCQMKQKCKKKGLVTKPMIFSEMNSRAQVDLIDMQSQADGEYRFIMVYQDHVTKFVQIRALKTKRAEEVAKHIIDIFCIFGAPIILQSDNGREFVNQIINDLKCMWNNLKIVHGKPRHSQSQGSVERANQDIQNILTTWMQTNNSKSWSEGLRFVQLMKNRAFHSGIKRSPYQAMFGSDIKIGLSTSILPPETINNISSEEDLENVLQNIGGKSEESNSADANQVNRKNNKEYLHK